MTATASSPRVVPPKCGLEIITSLLTMTEHLGEGIANKYDRWYNAHEGHPATSLYGQTARPSEFAVRQRGMAHLQRRSTNTLNKARQEWQTHFGKLVLRDEEAEAHTEV